MSKECLSNRALVKMVDKKGAKTHLCLDQVRLAKRPQTVSVAILNQTPRVQCYKTFCGRKLRIFSQAARVFVYDKPFQLSIMFLGKA